MVIKIVDKIWRFNNCGKKFLLQLIEVRNDSWTDLIDENALNSLCLEENEQSSIFEISEDTISNFVDCVNENIINKIDDIIFSTFGKKIDISAFKIDVCLEKGEKKTENAKQTFIGMSELFVYEFVDGENGKSVVEEKVFNPKSGYQFDLFTSTAFEVYQEAQKLEDILESE